MLIENYRASVHLTTQFIHVLRHTVLLFMLTGSSWIKSMNWTAGAEESTTRTLCVIAFNSQLSLTVGTRALMCLPRPSLKFATQIHEWIPPVIAVHDQIRSNKISEELDWHVYYFWFKKQWMRSDLSLLKYTHSKLILL